MGVAATGAVAQPAGATPHRPSPPADAPRPGSDQPLLDPDVRPNAIPPQLWNRLMRRRDRLETQGAVFCEAEPGRRPRYRLRYRRTESRVDALGYHTSRRRQPSIELGNEEVARTVERLLAVWRDDDVVVARMRRLYAASKAEAEREERRRLRAQVDAAHDAAIAEDAERSRLAALAPEDDDDDEPDLLDAASIPRLPPPLAIVPCYRPLSWRETRKFLIDCVRAPPDSDDERHERNVRALAAHHEGIAAAHLPNELLDRLTALKGVLVEYGAILKRRELDRRPSYRLRVRAPHERYGRTHRSIRLREEEVAWVELLLMAWRAPSEAAEQRRRNVERRLARERRQMGRLLTEFRATARDRPELMREAIDMASVMECLVRGEAPFRLVPM